MLIQITNQCFEECAHCLQMSHKNGQHMDMETFKHAIAFAKWSKTPVVAISGGEPTLNPEFYEFCKYLNFTAKIPFTVVSNGTWVDNPEMVEKFKRILCWKYALPMQVYSNKKWYKSYDKVTTVWKPVYDEINRHVFDKICNANKIIVDTTSPIFMDDLGRAKTSPEAQLEVQNNPYHMSCMNPALVCHQTRCGIREISVLKRQGRMGIQCKPLIDFQGNVHMSESWLCPSIGNVTEDTFLEIERNATKFIPCGKCMNFKHFMEDMNPKIVAARRILNL